MSVLLTGLHVALAVLVAVTASAAEPEVLAGNASDAVLVLPLNVVSDMPPELASVSPVVWEDLTGYLQESGKTLKTARMTDARNLWRASIRQVREEEAEKRAVGFEDALQRLAVALAQHADFAYVIVPSLLLRQAAVRDRRAEWDGVSQSVEFRADSLETRKLAILIRFEGLAPAASLHVAILDAEGRKVQETVRGLELISAVRVLEDPNEPFVYESRRDLFEDHAATRRSIAQALTPFIALEWPASE